MHTKLPLPVCIAAKLTSGWVSEYFVRLHTKWWWGGKRMPSTGAKNCDLISRPFCFRAFPALELGRWDSCRPWSRKCREGASSGVQAEVVCERGALSWSIHHHNWIERQQDGRFLWPSVFIAGCLWVWARPHASPRQRVLRRKGLQVGNLSTFLNKSYLHFTFEKENGSSWIARWQCSLTTFWFQWTGNVSKSEKPAY